MQNLTVTGIQRVEDMVKLNQFLYKTYDLVSVFTLNSKFKADLNTEWNVGKLQGELILFLQNNKIPLESVEVN